MYQNSLLQAHSSASRTSGQEHGLAEGSGETDQNLTRWMFFARASAGFPVRLATEWALKSRIQ